MRVAVFIIFITSACAADELDRSVFSIFNRKCLMCHDALSAAAAGSVDFLGDLVELSDPANGLLDLENPDESYLLEIISTGKMPARKLKGIKWAGPLEPDEKQLVTAWISRGGAKAQKRTAERSVVTEQDIVDVAGKLIDRLSQSQARDYRYLSLTNLHNDSRIPETQLTVYRKGAVKMLNSLSRAPNLAAVRAFGPSQTLLAFRLSDLGWTSSDWETIVRHYPYGLAPINPSAWVATGTKQPVIRADWFVFATSQSPLYYTLLRIPGTLNELAREMGISLADNIREERVARAGFGKSGVSRNNRLIERHSLGEGAGGFWVSYDFASSLGRQNLFDHPLGPLGAGLNGPAFKHDGGEVIFGLRNGLQGYGLFDASGNRLDVAPTNIVFDNTMPSGAILNGISCISCHDDGMKPSGFRHMNHLDEVRAASAENYREFTAQQRATIQSLYVAPNEFAKLLRVDRDRFRSALTRAGVQNQVEPVRAIFNKFIEDVDLRAAAADLGTNESTLREKLSRENALRQLRKRFDTGGINREVYVDAFKTIAKDTGLGDPTPFLATSFPYFTNENIDTQGKTAAKQREEFIPADCRKRADDFVGSLDREIEHFISDTEDRIEKLSKRKATLTQLQYSKAQRALSSDLSQLRTLIPEATIPTKVLDVYHYGSLGGGPTSTLKLELLHESTAVSVPRVISLRVYGATDSLAKLDKGDVVELHCRVTVDLDGRGREVLPGRAGKSAGFAGRGRLGSTTTHRARARTVVLTSSFKDLTVKQLSEVSHRSFSVLLNNIKVSPIKNSTE